MSAKNSGVTEEQYKQYAEDKRKAGKPQPRRVTLEVWRSEDKLPEITNDPLSDSVLVWIDGRELLSCVLWSCGGSSAWLGDDEDETEYPTDGTSWAYIPDITTEEAI